MNIQIYFPSDLIRQVRQLHRKNTPTFIIGYQVENIYVIVQLLTKLYDLNELPESLKGVEIIGSLNHSSSSYNLLFEYDTISNLPKIINEDGNNHFIIIFDPPKYRNLEYFSIIPIYLQSMGKELVTSDENKLHNKIQDTDLLTTQITSVSEDIILDKINQTFRIRSDIKKLFAEPSKMSQRIPIKIFQSIKLVVFSLLSRIIKLIQYGIIFCVHLLNLKIFNKSLVDISLTARQFDLRLNQINFLPVQYLCYYDKSRLYNQESTLLKNLNLPTFNSNLNINNSNYINFYNTLWLIFNDILVGVTVYNTIQLNKSYIIDFIHNFVIKRLLFDEVFGYLSWVSFDHPAGFKLNNELGSFMGDLYLWSLSFWKYFINDLYKEISPTSGHYILSILLWYLKFLCFFGGISFFIGSVIDAVNILTIHLNLFYLTASKIYNRQLQVLLSLFQLFRGKKYNVLRDRIDSLDIYGEDDSFDIVQLLMGTLIFMVLVLLLPTVFAFYLMFFFSKMLPLLLVTLLEGSQIFFNFVPMFVILLKLKNSNRLQGGISFEFILKLRSTTYVKLSNKALGYNEILRNFVSLLKNLTNLKKPIYKSFVMGEPLEILSDPSLKFNYLMLPSNYKDTVKIWDQY